MTHIPFNLLTQLLEDPYYGKCARKGPDCHGRITFEHAFLYANKQINEKWAIIPLCWYHHLGDGLVKRVNQWLAACRATDDDMKKYPRLDWANLRKEPTWITKPNGN